MPGPETPTPLHQWLLATAERLPDRPAIVEGDRVTLFGELVGNSTAISRALTARGFLKGDRLAVVAPKTTDSITVLFATLMAGGVCVPVDPNWPPERVDAILQDCSARFIFREGEITSYLEPADVSEPRASASDAEPVVPEDPALILFTSGSTGRAKGVVLSHRAVGAFAAWCCFEFGINDQDRIASPSSLNFDLSTFDIFSMALRGAACVIASEQIIWMPRFLARFAAEARITAWYSVPSLLTAMLDAGKFTSEECPDLRLVLFAGETVAARNAMRLVRAFPLSAIYNLYGPTETNVVTYFRLPDDLDEALPIPIGIPCPYARLALDPASVEDAEGGTRVGELLAGGESQMDGYWNLPEETGRAFRNLTAGGPRLYRTGDRVSVDGDGRYTFIGRLDRQVKRRGFRIELGEIEAALLRHPAVQETAVIAIPDERRGVTIRAFVRAANTAPEAEILSHCAAILPDYMLPDRIIPIDSIPRGSRGKIDYSKLSDTDGGRES